MCFCEVACVLIKLRVFTSKISRMNIKSLLLIIILATARSRPVNFSNEIVRNTTPQYDETEFDGLNYDENSEQTTSYSELVIVNDEDNAYDSTPDSIISTEFEELLEQHDHDLSSTQDQMSTTISSDLLQDNGYNVGNTIDAPIQRDVKQMPCNFGYTLDQQKNTQIDIIMDPSKKKQSVYEMNSYVKMASLVGIIVAHMVMVHEIATARSTSAIPSLFISLGFIASIAYSGYAMVRFMSNEPQTMWLGIFYEMNDQSPVPMVYGILVAILHLLLVSKTSDKFPSLDTMLKGNVQRLN